MKLEGRVAVVTGGANGIGAQTALRFLREGAQVVIGDLNTDNAERVLAKAAAEGLQEAVKFKRTDVSNESDMEAMFQLALSSFGRLDYVFNNAGIGGVFGPIEETSVQDWDFTLSVLLRGTFLGMKHGAHILKDRGHGGSIISTASIAALSGGSGSHCYSAAKAAVVSLTRTVAVELAPHRIRVNAIAPGPLMTELFHRGQTDKAERSILDRQPWPDAGQASDIAGIALFLASSDSAFVTGETIVADGGLLARGPALFGEGEASRIIATAGVDRGTTGERSKLQAASRPQPVHKKSRSTQGDSE